MSGNLKFAREFSSPWASAVVEIADFIQHQLMLAGDWQQARIHVEIAKSLVPPEALQPEFGRLKSGLEQIRQCQVTFRAVDIPAHRVELLFWR